MSVKLGKEEVLPTEIAKAYTIEPSNARNIENAFRDDRIFEDSGSLAPPYSFDVLASLFENSNALRQNVEAYAVNIDGFGHRFEPVIDLDADISRDQISDLMIEERGMGDDPNPPLPTESEIDEYIKELQRNMRKEFLAIKNFFRFCCMDESFISLRMKTRQEREILGNGFWEVIRGDDGEIQRFQYIPSYTVRMLPLQSDRVEVTSRLKTQLFDYQEVIQQKRFRKYIQIFEGDRVYFKEFGDPRVLSADSGYYYDTKEDMIREESTDEGYVPVAATELIHFKIHSLRSSYGVCRWIGTLISVLGSRQSEEVNLFYFENKSVPPLAVLVSGGTLSSDSQDVLKTYVENHIKGRENFHNILVIEGVSATNPMIDVPGGSMKIELVPLTKAQHTDALFQNYDERNIDKVGMSFRLPRMLRGDIRDFNRSCYDEETETLTNRGWKKLDEFEPDDLVAAYDPEKDVLEFVKPSALMVYDVDEELIHFKTNDIDCMVTSNHTMLVRNLFTSNNTKFEIHKADSIPYDQFFFKQTVGTFINGEDFISDFPKRDGTFTINEFVINEPRKVPYKGRVYCFSVPTHGFFATRRNGKIAIQGNTSLSALEFAEMQVFQPEREEFDWFINNKIFPALGFKYWTFKSNAPVTSNPLDISKIVSDLVTASILIPEEGRELAQSIFNRDFKKIDQLWTKIPPNLMMKGIGPDGPMNPQQSEEEPSDDMEEEEEEAEEKESKEETVKALAKDLFRLKLAIDEMEAEESKTNYNIAKDIVDSLPQEREVIKVPQEELEQFFEKD